MCVMYVCMLCMCVCMCAMLGYAVICYVKLSMYVVYACMVSIYVDMGARCTCMLVMYAFCYV